MAAEFGIVYPLWDAASDDGRLLEQVAGEVGIDHLTVPVVTGAQTQFRLARGHETPHFHTEGGWHYRASTKVYSGSTLKPTKGRWFAGGDVLADVRRRAAEMGIRLMVRVDLRAVRGLVDNHPHICQRNAWGQEVPFAGGCANNPDLRELLRAVLEDLRRYEPAGIELVDWAPDSPVDRAAARPLSWHPHVRRLLDACFCASCRQIAERAGVDPDQAARSVRASVERGLAGPHLDDDAPTRDPVLAAYTKARNEDCAHWLQRLAEGDTESRRFLVRPFGEPRMGNYAPWVRLVRIPPLRRGPQDAAGWADLERALGEISALSIGVWRPTFADAAEVVRLTSDAVLAGVTTFDFEGLNEAPPEAVTWLKHAVRKARRE